MKKDKYLVFTAEITWIDSDTGKEIKMTTYAENQKDLKKQVDAILKCY